MSGAVARLASLADRLAMVLPGNTHAAPFTRISDEALELTRQGIGARDHALADRLAQTLPPASVTEVLEDAEHRATAVAGALGGRAQGYRWASEDGETPDWYPQGLTGSADAEPSGLVSGRDVHAVSWYSKRGSGVRVTFVDVDAARYRHVLLVKPRASGDFDLVKVHAGGIAWLGPLLYVADTRRGVRVFDTARMMRVPRSRLADARGHRYVLPQVGSYRSAGDDLAYSYLALDRSARSLVVGEYRQARGGRIARWPVDLNTGLIASSAPTEAYAAAVDRLQGAVTIGGVLLASSSRMGGRLYAGRAGERTRKHLWWPYLPEDLYHSSRSGELCSVTEAPGRRMVFGVGLAELGL